MTDQDRIGPGKVVKIAYVATGDDGKVVDNSGPEGMEYLHGAENIVPGLEKALTGSKVGDKFQVVVAPADGYGERVGQTQKIPRKSFPDDVEIEVGMEFMAEGPGGDPMPVWVVGVGKNTIEIDRNHPLAGLTIKFEGEILAMRAASKEEKAHGHPHGPGGHHHH